MTPITCAQPIADQTTTARESQPAAGIGTVANLGNANLKDCRAASAAMGQNAKQRAKTQPLSAKEVSDIYDQLSKLLEAHDGAVGKPERVLAAETFAHHMGEPTNIDQGQHNTCNVTTLEEHLITRNPSKAAEIVTTMATTGHWTAPDGKDITITPGSLVPGAEEKNNRLTTVIAVTPLSCSISHLLMTAMLVALMTCAARSVK